MEESQDVRDVNQDASGNEVSESSAQESVSYDAYRKLLAQRKSDQEKLREFEDRFKSIEESKLEAEGKKDDLVKSLRERLAEKDQALSNVQQKYATKTLTEQIKSKAIEMGCKPQYSDKLIKLLDDSDLKAIQVDDNYRVNMEDLSVVLEKAKKDVPDLFGKTVSIADKAPSPQLNLPSDKKELSTSDLQEMYVKQFGL